MVLRRKISDPPLPFYSCWIVFWHVLALALCAVILCINQLIQCPIYTLTDYPVYTVNPINLQRHAALWILPHYSRRKVTQKWA